jgi:aspartyl-tRNA(Asn)/glutamyl-tRNA(Gln) amidotransferase subunit A
MNETAKDLVADPGAVAELAKAIGSGKTTPRRLLDASVARIEKVEPQVKGWREVDRDGAYAQADRLGEEAAAGKLRGPLHGIPVAVKDVIDVAGLPTRANSPTRANARPSPIDAQVVSLLRTAGAVILGKAHTTEFATSDTAPPTRNPHNLEHTPGGSSAGSAALVAAGMAPLSLGTQTAGSVNRPAAYCGIAAFKPSTRAWSGYGVLPFSPTFDTVGVFGYRTADATAAARVLSPPFLAPARGALPPLAELSVAFVQDPILADGSEAVTHSVRAAFDQFKRAGVNVHKRASPVALAEVVAWHRTVIEYEITYAEAQLADAPESDVSAGIRGMMARGRATGRATYADALRAIDDARARFWSAMADVDVLLFPAAPDIAPAGMRTGDPKFIAPFTAFGGPMVTVPTAIGPQGLPLALMIMGPPGSDLTLAELGDRLAPIIELPR